MSLTKKEESELLQLQAEEENHWKNNKLGIYYGDHDYIAPDGTTVCGREKYPKHLKFFNAGTEYTLRAFIAGNQTGKSLAGCIEDVYHATGLYPAWWNGYRFHKPVSIWLCGDRAEAIRDGLQVKLLGTLPGEYTGLIPKDLIVKLGTHSGISNCVGQYFIKHVSGGVSTITIKTYQSGRTAFESSVIDVIHLDEECPRDIFSECCTRTTNSNGILYLTFTPDSGLTDTVMFFIDPQTKAKRHVTTVGWDDVPHITKERKQLLLATFSPHERDCRSKGTPYLGKGKIFPQGEDTYVIQDIPLSSWWPRVYGFDVGFSHPTAVLWLAWDRESDIVYVYSEHKLSKMEPFEHAGSILNRGKWIPGVIDTDALKSSPLDGRRLIDVYRKLGLELYFCKKFAGSVESGIFDIYDRLSTGRLKIFESCRALIDELRIYRRNDDGKIVNNNDDLIAALRYAVSSGLQIAVTEREAGNNTMITSNTGCGQSPIGGY